MKEGLATFECPEVSSFYPRTFAPVWDVFKTSTEKLASCHMELVRKLQELIKEVQKYVEEQAKAHKKVRRWRISGSVAFIALIFLILVLIWYLSFMLNVSLNTSSCTKTLPK